MKSNLRVEYLIVLDKKGSICGSTETFKNLIQSNDDLEIKNGKIIFQKTIEAGYQITTNEIENKNQRYFHLTLTFQNNHSNSDKNIENYTKLLRGIKSVISLVTTKQEPIEPLWDDISLYYSQKAYPLIHEIENLMRKLITNFMLTKIGTSWTKETLPQAVKEDIDKNDQRNSRKTCEGYTNILYSVDFIKLKNMLFDPYPKNSNIDQLRRKIDQAQKIDDLNLVDLKAFVPRSNWERYFDKTIVDYPAEKLTQQWDKLYLLRCQIAHNRTVNKGDLNSIVDITESLRSVLQKATDDLYKVHVPEEEQEVVAESLASNINELYGEFIVNWKNLENTLLEKVRHANLDADGRRFTTFRQTLDTLLSLEIITKEQYRIGLQLNRMRNVLVHQPDAVYSEDEIRYSTHMILEYLSIVIRGIDKYEQEFFADTNKTRNSEEEKEIGKDQEE